MLPFNNLSDNAEDEYLADGMVEDIITTLSKSTYFLVIARNSTFRYKGSSPDIREVGLELGVQRLPIYPLLHVTKALALAGLDRLAEANDAMAHAVEMGQGVEVAVLEQRILEYSESPPRKAKIQALFSAIDHA